MSETADGTTETDPMIEVKAMENVAAAIRGLDAAAVGRVLRWAAERFSVTFSHGGSTVTLSGFAPKALIGSRTPQSEGERRFEAFADLWAATTPDSEADKALVAGYWFQFVEGKAEFGSQEINIALRDMGSQIRNITSAFDALKARKPSAVVQLRKAGSTRQARKVYKLTVAGKQTVEAMIEQHAS